jgi:Homeodomain-like domain
VIAQEAKYRAIYHYRKKYPVVDMCRFLEVSRSAYYDWIKRKDQPSRDAELTELIREGITNLGEHMGIDELRYG